MKQRHQPLVNRYRNHDPDVFYNCTCGVSCGTTLDSWRSHAADQKVLNPEIAAFNPKVLTPELFAMQRAMREVGKSFGRMREVYGRAFKKIAEPFRHLNETADLDERPQEYDKVDAMAYSLAEQGRRLASEREDLVASGVDPADLEIPVHPEDPE